MTDAHKPPAPRAERGGSGRRRARVLCLRALYRAEVAGDDLDSIRAEVAGEETTAAEIRDYAARVLARVVERGSEIDDLIQGALRRWDLKRLAVIDRCVLRIAVAELLFEPDVPARVVLDEAIEIAKQFGTRESGRFVNGVLDRIARNHRKGEIS